MRLPTPLGGATPPSPPSDEEPDPAASLKRKAADALGEALDMADSFRVCTVCRVPHPEEECPGCSEGETLIQTYLHMQHEDKPIEVSRLVEEGRDTVIEQLSTMLQKIEDVNKYDFDYGAPATICKQGRHLTPSPVS